MPLYWLFEEIPATSEGAKWLGLVTLGEMAGGLVAAAENSAHGARIVAVPEIRRLAEPGKL